VVTRTENEVGQPEKTGKAALRDVSVAVIVNPLDPNRILYARIKEPGAGYQVQPLIKMDMDCKCTDGKMISFLGLSVATFDQDGYGL
jgi:hypothetical protein